MSKLFAVFVALLFLSESRTRLLEYGGEEVTFLLFLCIFIHLLGSLAESLNDCGKEGVRKEEGEVAVEQTITRNSADGVVVVMDCEVAVTLVIELETQVALLVVTAISTDDMIIDSWINLARISAPDRPPAIAFIDAFFSINNNM